VCELKGLVAANRVKREKTERQEEGSNNDDNNNNGNLMRVSDDRQCRGANLWPPPLVRPKRRTRSTASVSSRRARLKIGGAQAALRRHRRARRRQLRSRPVRPASQPADGRLTLARLKRSLIERHFKDGRQPAGAATRASRPALGALCTLQSSRLDDQPGGQIIQLRRSGVCA
jgi:hypothetical protein